jgi:cytidylate kinase
MSNKNKPPVITIDGPSGVGKGTLAIMLANHLGWHILDSGALYRLTALSAYRQSADINSIPAIVRVAQTLAVEFVPGGKDQPVSVLLSGKDVTKDIRTELCGSMASQIAPHWEVRAALLQRQRDFLQEPGLIADGRDMGTVVFPDADCKLFITASPEERARRRYLQLKQQGQSVKIAHLLHEIKGRDERDMNRKHAPLKPADDAVTVDTSDMSIDEVFQKVAQIWSEAQQ